MSSINLLFPRGGPGCLPSCDGRCILRCPLSQTVLAAGTRSLHCTLLYSTDGWKYCNVLCSTVLYSTVQYNTVLYCTVMYFTVLYCTVLYCTVLYCTVLYCTVLYCIVHCTFTCCSWLLAGLREGLMTVKWRFLKPRHLVRKVAAVMSWLEDA